MHTPRKWKMSKESVCKWTKMNSGPFKTSNLTIPDNFSVNINHLGPFQGPPTKFEKISDFATFREWKSYLETPANISKVQKYGPSSFAWVEDMTWPQLSPKQLVSISHPTPDLILPRSNFHLSVFNPKSQIAMHMTRKWNRSKNNVFKLTKINAEPFNTPTLTISDNFSINKSHQGPFQRLPTKTKKIQNFVIFFKWQRPTEAQLPTST